MPKPSYDCRLRRVRGAGGPDGPPAPVAPRGRPLAPHRAQGRGSAHPQGRDRLGNLLDGLEMEHRLLRRQAGLVDDTDLASYKVDSPLSGPLPVESNGRNLASASAAWLPRRVSTRSLRAPTARCEPGTRRPGPQGRSPRPYKVRNIKTPATTPITSCTIAPFTPLTSSPPLSRSCFRAPSRSPRRSLYRPEEPSPGSETAASTVRSAMSKTSMILATLPVVSITPT
jgi:hypothetical protein